MKYFTLICSLCLLITGQIGRGVTLKDFDFRGNPYLKNSVVTWICMVLLNVHLKNDVFPIFFPFPLYHIPYTPSSLPIAFLASQFTNCMQKAVSSACLSWDLGFKKPKPILLNQIYIIYWKKNISCYCIWTYSVIFSEWGSLPLKTLAPSPPENSDIARYFRNVRSIFLHLVC